MLEMMHFMLCTFYLNFFKWMAQQRNLCPLTSLRAHILEPEEELDELVGGNPFIRRTCPHDHHPSSCRSLLSGLGENQGTYRPPHSFTHTSCVQEIPVGASRVPAFLVKGSGVLLRPPRWKGRQMRAEAHLPGVHARCEHQAGRTGRERLAGQCPCSQLCLGPGTGCLEAT